MHYVRGIMSSCGWVRHRSGSVDLRSERSGITGPWGRRRRGTSGPARSRERPWGRRSVHRLTKTASPRRIGAFVYTVGLWRRCGQARGSQECTQIDQNGLSVPFRGICVHCCDAKVARVVTRAASGGMSTPTTMTCRRYPLVAASPLVGKTGSARQALREWRHRQVGVFPKRQPT